MKRYIRAAEEAMYEYNGMEFNKSQITAINEGLSEGLDVSWYTNPKFDCIQMYKILYGLRQGLDVSWYASPDYTPRQMEAICDGLERGFDVSIYADPKYDGAQMGQIYMGLKMGLDISWYANPAYTWDEMVLIRIGLEEGWDVSIYANPEYSYEQMKAIYDNVKENSNNSYDGLQGFKYNPNSVTLIQSLEDNLNIDTRSAKFIAKINAEDIGDTDCNTEQECIDYIIESTPDRFQEILLNEGYEGLVEWYGDDFANQFLDAAKALGINVDEY